MRYIHQMTKSLVFGVICLTSSLENSEVQKIQTNKITLEIYLGFPEVFPSFTEDSLTQRNTDREKKYSSEKTGFFFKGEREENTPFRLRHTYDKIESASPEVFQGKVGISIIEEFTPCLIKLQTLELEHLHSG